MTRRIARGAALAVAVALALVAVDIAFDQVQISGSFMLGAFVAAVLADVRVTVAVAILALVLSAISPLWNDDVGTADYLIKLGITVFGDLFAIETARLRRRTQRSLREQSVLAALADLPAPGATLDETVERVTELLVPRVVSFAAVDARRGAELVRVAEQGKPPHDPAALLTTELRARGREIGALTVDGGRLGAHDEEFLRVLAGRAALALDNAGMSQELETAEQRLNAILGNLGEAVTVQDRSGRLVFANHAAADLLGAASVDELLTADPRELIGRFDAYNEDGTPLRADQLPGRHVLAGEHAEPLVVRTINRATGEERWRMTKATPILGPDGKVALAVNVIEDVTESKRMELAQRLLADASGVLSESLDYEGTLQRVAELAVPELADWCSVGIPRGPFVETVAIAHSDPSKVEWARRHRDRFKTRRSERDGAAEVLRTGRSLVVPAVTPGILDGLDDEQRELADQLGMTSVMLIPMGTAERTTGVISMVTAESGRRFSDADVALAEEISFPDNCFYIQVAQVALESVVFLRCRLLSQVHVKVVGGIQRTVINAEPQHCSRMDGGDRRRRGARPGGGVADRDGALHAAHRRQPGRRARDGPCAPEREPARPRRACPVHCGDRAAA